MTSQYQLKKSRREVKRLQKMLAEAEARQASFAERGAKCSAEEAGEHVAELQAAIKAETEWQEQAEVTQFYNWSPARLQRHQKRKAVVSSR